LEQAIIKAIVDFATPYLFTALSLGHLNDWTPHKDHYPGLLSSIRTVAQHKTGNHHPIDQASFTLKLQDNSGKNRSIPEATHIVLDLDDAESLGEAIIGRIERGHVDVGISSH